MSNDLRLDILDRLFDILQTVDGLENFFRNIDEIPNDKRPCGVLIDGDEIHSDRSSRQPFGMRGRIMLMTPIIAIGVKAKPENISAATAAARLSIIPKVLGDAQLITMLTANGNVAYDGLTGRLSHGSLMAADSELRFSIYYPFDPARL